jgi:hypothetical protein
MRGSKMAMALMVLMAAAAVSEAVDAASSRGGGGRTGVSRASGGHGGGYRGGYYRYGHSHVRYGFALGWPWYPYYAAPYYYPPSYYSPYYDDPYARSLFYFYPAPPATPDYLPQYTESGPTQAAPPGQGDSEWWYYYCAESNGFYPYVKECAAGWVRVPPRPPS